MPKRHRGSVKRRHSVSSDGLGARPIGARDAGAATSVAAFLCRGSPIGISRFAPCFPTPVRGERWNLSSHSLPPDRTRQCARRGRGAVGHSLCEDASCVRWTGAWETPGWECCDPVPARQRAGAARDRRAGRQGRDGSRRRRGHRVQPAAPAGRCSRRPGPSLLPLGRRLSIDARFSRGVVCRGRGADRAVSGQTGVADGDRPVRDAHRRSRPLAHHQCRRDHRMSGAPPGQHFSGWAGSTAMENPPPAQGRRRSPLTELLYGGRPTRNRRIAATRSAEQAPSQL